LLVLVLAAGAGSPAVAAEPRPLTVPAVREWRASDGALRLPSHPRIVVRRQDRRELQYEARLLARELHGQVARGGVRPGDVVLELGSRNRDLGREGYRMAIAKTVRISARSDAGVFYGTRTLLQLLRQSRRLPPGTIRDWPRYPERGLMVDVGRKYLTPGWLKARVRELAWLKLNYLHLHLSDNEGFGIASDTHPEIVSPRHLTRRDVRRLVAVAERHHVTVVPEIDMPGHMRAALASHPELQLTDALGGTDPDNLDVTDPAALRFARDLIDELAPLFPGPYWHGGADEYLSPAAYPLYPSLATHARARYGPSATAKDAVHGFINEIARIADRNGKVLRVWSDELGGGSATRVTPEAVVEWWTNVSPLSDPRPPAPQELLDRGHRIMNAGWFPTYYVGGPLATVRPDMRTAYEHWAVNDFYGPFVLDETLAYPPETVSPDEPHNVGAKLNVWNDDGERGESEEDIARGIRPRLRVLAQKTWDSPPLTESYEEFTRIAEAAAR
jgi:hexosaminidase